MFQQICKLSRIVGCLSLFVFTYQSQADELIGCYTVGKSNNGTAYGVRLFQDDKGDYKAYIDQVSMFHYMVYQFNQKPVAVLGVIKIQNVSGQQIYQNPYFFTLLFDGVPNEANYLYGYRGQATIRLNGLDIKDSFYEVNDINSGYCEER